MLESLAPIVLGVLLLGGLIAGLIALAVRQARKSGEVAHVGDELDATIQAARRVEDARRRNRLRGRDLLDELRRDAEKRNGPDVPEP